MKINKSQIRFYDIIVDWNSMNTDEFSFNHKNILNMVQNSNYSGIVISKGRIFVHNSELCLPNELMEWSLVNVNDLSENEIYLELVDSVSSYSESIFYSQFELDVVSCKIELVGIDELSKIQISR